MIEIVPACPLSAAQVAKLAQLLGAAVGEIRRCSERREPLRTVEIFGGRWQDERLLLVAIHRSLRSDSGLFSVRDIEDGDQVLTADELRNRLLFWRSLELEQERARYLEIGAIASPSEFRSSEPDWTSALE